MKSIHTLQIVSLLAGFVVFTGAVNAATITTDQTFTTDPPLNNVYFYTNTNGTNPAGNTWMVNGQVSVGNGVSGDDRLFVGLRDGSGTGNGKLTLTTTLAGSTLLLNGNAGDGILGRLGHDFFGAPYTGSLNIDGGLAVTMGGRFLRYEGGVNTINILNGSLNYTTSGFGWQETGTQNAFVKNIIGASGSIMVPGNITDITGFTNWARATNSASVEANDITVEAASGLYLQFTPSGGNTIITAIPEPGVFGLASVALLLGSFFGRRRKI